ncbi:MAG: DUF87 domain-containing protein [Haloarculaceae archaeon]
MTETPDAITLSADGFAMPTVEVLTGRGFVTGKSGSGKSNTASVVCEELLDAGAPLLVVDTDGEYYGLKEQYELLHVGGDERCDLRIGVDDADRLARVALDRHVPVILDTSGFDDPDGGRAVVGAVVERLFAREREARTPFLLLVEEAHEFVPQQGGLDDVGEALVRVAKRGRKRGLGMCALSQRPAAVSKDYITQCDWLVWHRLTWDTDTAVVSRVLGGGAAADVQELADGEAIVRTDWDGETRRVRFRRKRTFDAGATPDLDDIERPDLKSVDDDLLAELRGDAGDATSDTTATDGADDPTRTDATDDGGTASEGGASTAGRTAESAGTGTTAGTGTAVDGGPATDTAWEAARFLTFLSHRLVATLTGTLATAGALCGRGLSWTAARVARTPEDRPRVESRLRAVVLVVAVLLLALLAVVLAG